MKVLPDENFPLPLYHRLRAAGHDAEHTIVLGQRGIPDLAIRQRLMAEELVFLTNDTEFEDLPADFNLEVIGEAVRAKARSVGWTRQVRAAGQSARIHVYG